MALKRSFSIKGPELRVNGGPPSPVRQLDAMRGLRQRQRIMATRIVQDEAMEQPAQRDPRALPISQVLLTPEEAAAHLKLAPKTIRALCASRRISAIRICRRWRIPAEELEHLKQAHLSRAV
jgi:excisionase family DNA binding protein